MKSKKVSIEGFEDLEFTLNLGNIYVEVSVEDIKDLKLFGERIMKLASLGFQYVWTTYDLGYYDSVENKRMELVHRNPINLAYTILK